jgi:hypothetical protein
MSCAHTKFEGSPPCPCDWQKTNDVGIDVSGHATVSLVDYGVLKERARIIGVLEGLIFSDGEGDFYISKDWLETKALIEGETK